MSFPKPAAYYRDFRIRKINQDEYKHFKYWLFWPILGLRYIFVERIWPVDEYHVVHSPLDDLIPFREEFIIPYVFWYAFMFGMHLYLFFCDVEGFKKYSKFLCIAMTMSTIIFLLFPTCQNLRPTVYPRDNILTKAVEFLHYIDTNTNVCPSEHVIGSVAVVYAAMHHEKFRRPRRLLLVVVTAALIIVSTLFLKQHSVIDVVAALPICLIAYWMSYKNIMKKFKRKKGVCCEALIQ